jgi:hypothetical protein
MHQVIADREPPSGKRARGSPASDGFVASCGPDLKQAAAQQNLQHLLCLSNTDGIVLGEPMGSGRYGTVFEALLKGSHWPASLLGRDLVVKVLKSETVDEVGSKRRRDRIFDEFIFGSLRHCSLVGAVSLSLSCLPFGRS